MKTSKDTISSNKKAYFNYHIVDKIEAGIALTGYEIKSLREGKASLVESYAFIHDGEIWLEKCYIPAFKQANTHITVDTMRRRKLLLHKAEIIKLFAKVQIKGMTVVPLRLYLKHNRVKVELGLAQAKKLHDKRADLKDKAVKRDLDRKFS